MSPCCQTRHSITVVSHNFEGPRCVAGVLVKFPQRQSAMLMRSVNKVCSASKYNMPLQLGQNMALAPTAFSLMSVYLAQTSASNCATL